MTLLKLRVGLYLLALAGIILFGLRVWVDSL